MPEFPFRFLTGSSGNADAMTPVFERTDYACCTIEYIVSGSGFLEVNGVKSTPSAGDIYQLPKHSTHRYFPNRSDPWQKLFIVVDGDFMEELLRIHGLEKVYHIRNCRHLKRWFDRWCRQTNLSLPQELYALEFHQFVVELSMHVYREQGARENPHVRLLYEQLQSALEKPFSLLRFAEGTPYSETHLIRLFRERYGQTPYEFRMEKKMEQARILLRHSPLSIKEIAERLGFSSQYHLSGYFKSRTGVSPRRFRQTI